MRRNIDIVVKAPRRQYEYTDAWEHLDTYPNQKMTIQFISNLLTGVESITSSSTLSVKLPRTVRNERIFDLATRPQYNSSMTHRKIECRVYVNGIEMMKSAYCYILDCESDSYEIAIVFGLLQSYGAWIDAGKTIKELADMGQSVLWNWRAAFYGITVPAGSPHDVDHYPPIWYGRDANINTYTPANGLGRLMYYGIYTPGFERNDTLVEYANVHPFVTVREIYERIVIENSLDFIMPSDVLSDMENLAIVLTEVDGNAAQGTLNADNNTATGHPRTIRLSSALTFGWLIMCDSIGDCYQNGNTYGAKGKILHKGDADSVDIQVSMLLQDNSSFPYNGNNKTAGYILNAAGHLEYLDLCVYIYATQRTVRITPTYSSQGLYWQGTIHIPATGASEGDAIADIWIDNDGGICSYCEGAFETYWMLGRNDWDSLFTWQTCSVGVRYYTGSMIYPHPNYRCFTNLPDIKQLDFIKFICQLYCLFPVANAFGDERVSFVRFDFNEAKLNAYDWSDKLLECARDVPKRISFRIGDYARRNTIAYKEDGQDPVFDNNRLACLVIDDDMLPKERSMIELPLAASDGDYIGQYRITREYDDQNEPPTVTYGAEFIECAHRLMRVTEWLDPVRKKVTRLSFTNLSPQYIINAYYGAFIAAIRKPKTITEHIRLNEAEMRDIDFTRPVYLRKYGRFYAIKQIQWTTGDSYAEVELLQLDELNHMETQNDNNA